MPLKGAKAHVRRLRTLAGPRMVSEVGQALFVGADLIATEAAHSITAGAVSGAGHVPSEPGTPPNADTHVLDRGIIASRPAPLRARVTSTAPYSARHEFGPEGRAFMRPARDKMRAEVKALVEKAMNRVVRSSRSPD